MSSTRKPAGVRYSKRAYEDVAECIRAARAACYSGAELDAIIGINEVTDRLATMFKADNPEFDILKFITACTKGEEK